MKRVLLLGGTAESRALAEVLAGCDDVFATISLAGVVSSYPEFALEKRVGGFGGIKGLSSYILNEGIDVVIDATHPYAVQISHHAQSASDDMGIPCLVLNRPPWRATPHDAWREFQSWDDLIKVIPKDAHIFLAAGQDGIKAFDHAHMFRVTARILEQPQNLKYPMTLISSLPLSTPQEEIALFQKHGISHLVCKNSGGRKSMAKLAAARQLKLPVLMLARPPLDLGNGEYFDDIDSVLARLNQIS